MTKTEKLRYEDLELPNYINSRQVFAGLTVSDLPKTFVLGGLNGLILGDTGCGKSQLASDIYRYYFGGNKSEGGQGVFIRTDPDMNLKEEIFTELNIDRARREMTKSLDALIFFADELNRAPPIAQNQYFGLGDGKMDFKGREIQIGRDGYHLLISTANIGNGEFAGTFETDKALFNRLHVALDLEHGPFKPTYEDKQKIKERKANPNVVPASLRDISDRIVLAHREIGGMTTTLDLETRAALDYLEFGLDNCQRYPTDGKDRVWPMACQDCTHNTSNDALCSMIKAPTTRTMEVVRKYAAALEYLAKLKDPKVKVEPHELVFKAFELTGAYQHLLNPSHLRENHNHNPKLMAQVVEKLQADYESARPYILASLEMAQKGKTTTRFYTERSQFGLYDELNDKAKDSITAEEPYTNGREIGLEWVSNLIQATIKQTDKS